jgi:hypothetical protein
MRTEFTIPTAANLNHYGEDMEYLAEKVEKAIRDAVTEDLADVCVNNLGDYRIQFTIDIDCKHNPMID